MPSITTLNTIFADLLSPTTPSFLTTLQVQRLPTIINFYHVAKAAAQTHSH